MDKALKQRLVGASVLIALAVIVLPMLLSGRPESTSQQTQTIELPPRPDELSFETRRFPVTDPRGDERPAPEHQSVAGAATADFVPDRGNGKVTPEASPVSAQAQADALPEQVTARTREQDTEPQHPVTNEAPVPNETNASPGPGSREQQQAGRYVVQVASLSSSENAGRLMASLREKGFPVLMDTVDSAVGRLNRVRVGPFENEAEAAQASARIGKELAGVNPRVVDLLPDQSAAESNASDSLARWVVQVGSFADSGNAERLVGQLKKEGMSAYRETVTSSSSSIFRVRVGPFLEREEALRTRQSLSERLSIDGVVMSAD